MSARLASCAVIVAAVALAACGSMGSKSVDAEKDCAALRVPIPATAIGLPSAGATIESASLLPAAPVAVAERGQPTGGWNAWWLGATAPTLPPQPNNSIAWVYGSGAVQYFYARDPNYDVRNVRLDDLAPRIAQVSSIMDSTNPDLTAFQQHGGKLIVLENLGDYAQSPYAGIQYYESVVARMGKSSVDAFMRLYTAPGVDHVGSGAPANGDFFDALVAWVERGRAPSGLQLVEQALQQPFTVTRARPVCEWPLWPRYRAGNPSEASSFTCTQ